MINESPPFKHLSNRIPIRIPFLKGVLLMRVYIRAKNCILCSVIQMNPKATWLLTRVLGHGRRGCWDVGICPWVDIGYCHPSLTVG